MGANKEKTQEEEDKEDAQEEPLNQRPVKQEFIVSPYQPEEIENIEEKIENVEPSVAVSL
jgi:hypothetical protein